MRMHCMEYESRKYRMHASSDIYDNVIIGKVHIFSKTEDGWRTKTTTWVGAIEEAKLLAVLARNKTGTW